ncbi:MAG: hypothetical protein V4719_14970 [Planctomycetota bacterium]
MNEDTDFHISNCADLVTLEDLESFPLALLTDVASGQWIAVEKLCTRLGIRLEKPSRPEYVVSWLDEPFGDDNYVVIIFYDSLNVESFTALYNRRRLQRGASQ